MQKLVFRNANGIELDLTSDPFGITEWEGFSADELNIQSQQVPFQDGGVFLDALLDQRELSVTVAMNDENNLEKRYRLRREMISALNPKLGEGVLIYTNDFLSKQIHCIPQLPVFQNKNSNDSGTPKVSCSFTACNPYWEDLEETEVVVQDLVDVNNEGDVPCQIKALMKATTKNPFLYNRNNQKKIALNGEFKDDVSVNTEYGNKSITSQDIKFEWVTMGNISSLKYFKSKYIYQSASSLFTEDVITGERREILFNGDIYGIENNNDFVVVIVQGETISDYIIYKSSDLETWTEVYTFTAYREVDVVYINNVFFINTSEQGSGYKNIIYKSTDGETWNKVFESQTDLGLYENIAYGNGIYVIAMGRGTIKSSNGTDWTSTQISEQYFNDITFGNGVFVLVGTRLYIGTDGLEWTQKDSASYSGCVFGNGVFVCIASASNENKYSVDNGETWTTFIIESYIGLHGLVFQNGWLLMFARPASNQNLICIMSSSNGRNWIKRSDYYDLTNLGYSVLCDIQYLNYNYITAGLGGIVLESKTGIEWAENFNCVLHQNDITYFNNKHFIIEGQGDWSNQSTKVQSSTDGQSWKTESVISRCSKITKCGDKLICIRYDVGQIVESSDGEHWESHFVSSLTSATLFCATYADGTYVVGGWGVNGSGCIFTSTDLENWTIHQLASNVYVWSVAYGKGVCVAVTNVGVYTSADLENWELVYEFNFNTCDVIYANNKFVIAGIVHTSVDGYIWTKMTEEELGAYISYGEGMFVIVGNNKPIYKSIDCQNWDIVGIVRNRQGISYGNKSFVCVGNFVEMSVMKQKENLISKLTTDSDMTFNLEIGHNQLVFISETDTRTVVSYRQKYIGV